MKIRHGLGILLALSTAGCGILSSKDKAIEGTVAALNEGQTQVALTIEVQKGTLEAGATLIAQQATAAVQNIPSTSPTDSLIAASTPTQPLAPPASQTPLPSELDIWMKSANILLYEDMVNNPDTNRYVINTLELMDLPFKDLGSAKGRLKSDLLGGAPSGKPWDLVIIAAEAKSDVHGEFFEYVLQALEDGSSVILEVWYLDDVASGTASLLMARCGVEFQSDWSKVPPEGMVMFPLDAAHPILQEPNAGLSFTNVTSYWWDVLGFFTYDIGDRLRLTPGSSARLLIGTSANQKTSHGTLTVCVDDRLILQTFSSHQLSFNTMRPLWENYIYNALRARFMGGS